MSIEPTECRPVGRTGVKVTQLGFGAAAIANLFADVAETDALAALAYAYDSGIRFFDTAPLYGHGLSEHLLGAGLRWVDRDSVVVETKIGRLLKPIGRGRVDGGLFSRTLPFEPRFDYSRDGVLRSLEESLQRLGLGRVDLLLVHAADPSVHGNEGFEQVFRQVVEEAFPALWELRAAGIVGAIGAGLNVSATCRRFMDHCDFDLFLLSGRYTLLDQSALDEFLPACVERDVSVVIGSPFNSGILASGASKNALYGYAPASREVINRVKRIQRVADRHGVPMRSIALQFPFSHPAVVSVIPGMRTADEVRDNIDNMRAEIAPAVWNELEEEGLMRPRNGDG